MSSLLVWALVIVLVPVLWMVLAAVTSALDAAEERAVLRESSHPQLPAEDPAAQLAAAQRAAETPHGPAGSAPLTARVGAAVRDLPADFADAAAAVATELDRLRTHALHQPLSAEQEQEMTSLSAALLDSCRYLREIPADLREVAAGPEGSTPLQEALALVHGLAEGTARLRADVVARSTDRLRVLRRYAEDKYRPNRLDLD